MDEVENVERAAVELNGTASIQEQIELIEVIDLFKQSEGEFHVVPGNTIYRAKSF